MADDWFRSAAWDQDAQDEFAARLRRSRAYNRPQYLWIKGVALAEAGDTTAAISLWERVLNEYPCSLHAWPARESLGDVARQEGRLDEAERWYRELIEVNPTLNATTHMAEVSLAEILLAAKEEAKSDEGLRLLQSAIERGGLLNDQLFRWHLALIEAVGQLGDLETQQRPARTALSLLERGPRFSRHPTVGLAKADKVTVRRLRALAEGTSLKRRSHRTWSRGNA